MEAVYTRVKPEQGTSYKPGSIRFKQLGVINRIGPAGTHMHIGSKITVPVKQLRSGSFTSQRGHRTYDYKIPRFDPRSVNKFLPRGGSVMRVVAIEDTEDPLAFYNFRAPPRQEGEDKGSGAGGGGDAGGAGGEVPESIDRILRLASTDNRSYTDLFGGAPATPAASPLIRPLQSSLASLPLVTQPSLDTSESRVFNPMGSLYPTVEPLSATAEDQPQRRLYPAMENSRYLLRRSGETNIFFFA